jgi:predicted nucleic acid-binding protein
MSVLVDSSVWIAYFRGAGDPDLVDRLIDENLVVTNDLILTELIPALYLRNQRRLVGLLREIKRFPLAIDWDDIVRMQITCLRAGINGVGIPDLVIAQHAIRNRLYLFSHDSHFRAMSQHLPLSLYGD